MLGFLSNIGSGFGRLGSTIARGAMGAGRGIGRGVKRLGEPDDDEMSLGNSMRTPSFSPNAGAGIRSLEGAVRSAEGKARDAGAGLELFRSADDWGAPPLTDPDDPRRLMDLSSLASRVNSPDLPPPRAGVPLPISMTAPPLTPPKAIASPDALDRRNVPIPQLPGRSGEPIPYNPIDAARYDAVMRGAKRDEAGDLLTKEQGGGFRRDWKMAAKNALMGASQAAQGARPGENVLGRALGGALVAGVGSAINPQAGYEFAFDAGERPKIEERIARERGERARAMEEFFNRAKIEGMQSENDLRRAQTKKILEPPPPKPERQPAPQLRLGRNQETGAIGYYNALDPEQSAMFEAYQWPRAEREPSLNEELRQINAEEVAREGTPEQIATDSTNARINEIIKSAPEAIRSILQTGKKANGSPATARDTNQAQSWLKRQIDALYQQNLRHTRGVRERNKAQRVTGQKPTVTGSQPTAQRKARVGADFVNDVAKTLNISPAEARRRIEADGYEVR